MVIDIKDVISLAGVGVNFVMTPFESLSFSFDERLLSECFQIDLLVGVEQINLILVKQVRALDFIVLLFDVEQEGKDLLDLLLYLKLSHRLSSITQNLLHRQFGDFCRNNFCRTHL
jgi:hypothetical protein